jgi:tetratricopeptide (TPR) repeat protein
VRARVFAAVLAVCWAAVPAIAGDLSALDARLDSLRRAEAGAHAPDREEMAERLTALGSEYFAAGSIDRAIELFSEAVARDPDNGVALARLTVAYLRKGDREFAEFYLNLARQSAHRVEPTADTYVALGNAYEAENRLDDALEAWEEARRLGDRSDALARKISRVRADWAYSHGQRYRATDNFEIYYDRRIADSLTAFVGDSLEKALPEESRFFLDELSGSTIVILYEGRRFFELREMPDWVGGSYDGKIRVPIDLGRPPDEALLGLLRHELAHAFLARLSRGRAPGWLQEGLAQFVEGRRVDPSTAASTFAEKPTDILTTLEAALGQRADRAAAHRAYTLSLSFVEFLASRVGSSGVVCLAADLGQGRDLGDAFERQFGASPRSMEAAWLSSLQGAASLRARRP